MSSRARPGKGVTTECGTALGVANPEKCKRRTGRGETGRRTGRGDLERRTGRGDFERRTGRGDFRFAGLQFFGYLQLSVGPRNFFSAADPDL